MLVLMLVMLTGCGDKPKKPTQPEELKTMKITRFLNYNVNYNGDYQILDPRCNTPGFKVEYSLDGKTYYTKRRGNNERRKKLYPRTN